MVCLMWAPRITHNSFVLHFLFSKKNWLRVFHISQTTNTGYSSQILFKILFLSLFLGHSSIVRSGLPYCLVLLLNSLLPLSQISEAIGHSSSKWFIVSFLSSHKLHREGPARPCFWMLSQVRILLLITNQQKVTILGHQFPPQFFFHFSSFSCLWFSFIIPIASLMLNLPRLEYPHLILSFPSCQGILPEHRSL